MRRLGRPALIRHLLAAIIGLGITAVIPTPAQAGLTEWVSSVNSGTPPVFVATNIFTPSVVDIGAVSGDITYEFVVNGAERAGAGSLIGSLTGGQHQAIRFEQWHHTGHYGATQYGVADYDFGVNTTYDTDIVLDFVVNSAAGITTLYVNGVNTGATVPIALTLHGPVAFGNTDLGGGNFLGDDAFAGSIYGFADFNSALSADEIKAHSDAFFSTGVPEPATWTIGLGLAVIGAIVHRRRS